MHLLADQIPHWRNECATNLGLCLFEVNAFRARADNEGVVSWVQGVFWRALRNQGCFSVCHMCFSIAATQCGGSLLF